MTTRPALSRAAMTTAIVLATASIFVSAQTRGLDTRQLLAPLGESWPTYSGDYTGRRYSSLTQINQSNVKHLSLAWTARVTAGPGPAGPAPATGPRVVVGGEGSDDVVVAARRPSRGAPWRWNG